MSAARKEVFIMIAAVLLSFLCYALSIGGAH